MTQNNRAKAHAGKGGPTELHEGPDTCTKMQVTEDLWKEQEHSLSSLNHLPEEVSAPIHGERAQALPKERWFCATMANGATQPGEHCTSLLQHQGASICLLQGLEQSTAGLWLHQAAPSPPYAPSGRGERCSSLSQVLQGRMNPTQAASVAVNRN